jgi:hypothetical protein
VAKPNAGTGERLQSTGEDYLSLRFQVNPVSAPFWRRKMTKNNRKPSNRLTANDAMIIKKRLKNGEMQSRIAADFDVNIGRISEINTGKKFANV